MSNVKEDLILLAENERVTVHLLNINECEYGL